MSVAGSGEDNMESIVEYREMVSKKNDSMGKRIIWRPYLIFTAQISGESVEPEALNKKALDIVQRVRDKLTGKDFNTEVCIELSQWSLTFSQFCAIFRIVWEFVSRWNCWSAKPLVMRTCASVTLDGVHSGRDNNLPVLAYFYIGAPSLSYLS